MFARFVKPTAFKAAGGYGRIAQQARFLATVEGSAGRSMPVTRPKATPISHDRATLTLRVWNFGTNINIPANDCV
jgi:carbamoyl-phosphate synthase small subunit